MIQAKEKSAIKIISDNHPLESNILSEGALEFIAALQQEFNPKRLELLEARSIRNKELEKGINPVFLPETESVRKGDWKVAPVPSEIQDRRVEITGPVSRKMIINALNSGANVFMADFEDSNSPTWDNVLQGQQNLIDAVNGSISIDQAGKIYKLNKETAVLFVRPRGWHMEESHIYQEGKAFSASLFDFGLYFYHNAHALLNKGSNPYFYLPKIESHKEAKLWNEVFVFAQNYLGIPQGTIKATVLIETILAAFEMDEILYELKEHSAGLNCGRWDYIFSFIKKFIHRKDRVMPERSQVTMDVHFMKAYTSLLIKTCHKRGAHAMGGMAAQIPIKDNEAKNNEALAKVKADKLREVKAGHDGTWVAHPGLIPIAKEVFDEWMPAQNQLHKLREDVQVTESDLLKIPEGDISINGFRNNIDVCIQYMEAWLRGNGCVPIYNLMEDAATAEISRAQLWQWVNHGKCRINNGTYINTEFFLIQLQEILAELKEQRIGTEHKLDQAANLLKELTLKNEFEDFLTLKAYTLIK